MEGKCICGASVSTFVAAGLLGLASAESTFCSAYKLNYWASDKAMIDHRFTAIH